MTAMLSWLVARYAAATSGSMAAAWVVAKRYGVPPATLNRYLFPRR